MSELLLFSMYLFGFCFVLFALIMGGVGIYGMAEEKRIYEEKVIAHKKTLLMRQREREEEEIKARDKAVGG